MSTNCSGSPNDDSNNEKLKLLPSDVVQVISNATQGFRHAEAIVQSRLNNFLICASILAVSWATVFTSAHTPERRMILVVLAALGAILSISWAILGWRQSKFLQLHMDIICKLEERLNDEMLRVTQPIAHLQDGQGVSRGVSLSWIERKLRSRNLSWLAPAAFGLVFLLLAASASIFN